MTSVGAAVNRCYRVWLYGTYSRQINALAGPLAPGAPTLSLQYPTPGPAVGSLLAIGTELCQIVSKDQAGTTLTVIRGVQGTTIGAWPQGAEVEANPRYARGTVVEEMFYELVSWPDEVSRLERVSVTVPRCDDAFEVTGARARIRRVVDLQRPSRSSVYGGRDSRGYRIPYRDAYDVASEGDAWVYLDEMSPGCDYRAMVATDWPVSLDQWDEGTDLEADVGLTIGMVDALVLGATWRMVFGKEVRKLQTEAQGQSRDAQEVPAMALANLGLRLLALRDRRLDDEMQRVFSRYGFG